MDINERRLAIVIMSVVIILALLCLIISTWECGVIVFKGLASEDLSMNIITVSIGTFKVYVKLSNEKIYSIASCYGRIYVKPSERARKKMEAIKAPQEKDPEDKYTMNVVPEYRLVDYLEELRKQCLSPFDAIGYQCKNMITPR